jgi:hypothetical protein
MARNQGAGVTTVAELSAAIMAMDITELAEVLRGLRRRPVQFARMSNARKNPRLLMTC